MARVKCIGCYKLQREDWERPAGGREIVFGCPDHFPYYCAVSGLFRPGEGIREAAEECQEDPGKHCILCESTERALFGLDISICREHDLAWCEWLDQKPERRERLHPLGSRRAPQAVWFDTFRQFIEDMRRGDDAVR